MQKILKKTKLIATIGPSSESKEMMKKLFEAGMNIVRLNFSHGDHAEQLAKIETARSIEREEGQLVGIVLDTKGPEIRTGRFVGKKVDVKTNDTVILEMGTTDEKRDDKLGGRQPDGTIVMGITYTGLFDDCHVGDHIRMDDGKLDMVVTEKNAESRSLICRATNHDEIKDERGVNCPDTHLTMPYVSEKDRDDLIFGCEQKVNYCSASFVRNKQDILDIRKIFHEHGGDDIKIISKIENTEALENIDEIIRYSDGIMVARGDMGVNIPAWDVPVVQMRLVRECRKQGKPIIVATQMLDSMIHSPFPTRAEVTDVSFAVLQSADVVMLSGESANGEYPEESVTMQSNICTRMEAELDYEELAREAFNNSGKDYSDAIANAVVNAAYLTDAKMIVCFSGSGEGAERLSHCRPVCPTIFVTDNRTAAYDSLLWWGVYPKLVKRLPTLTEELEVAALHIAKVYDVPDGSVIIITGASPVGSSTTNFMKLVKVEYTRMESDIDL